MGKVYDALRRAEEQRTQGVAETVAAPAAPAPSIPVPSPEAKAPSSLSVATPAPKRSWFRRSAPAQADSASEYNKRRITLLQPESYVAEQFRTLRTRIDAMEATSPIRALSVTSARPGDGKTLTSLSLAVVTSMNVGRSVVLVDCDLRLPTVHKSLALTPEAGLAEVLAGEASVDQALHRAEGTDLDVIPVRSIPSNPAELLASDRMSALVEELTSRYDRVILDLPCTLGLPDAKTVSQLSDGIVFVVRAGVTPDEDVAAAIEVLDRRKVLGVVLNGAENGPTYGPYGY